MWRAAVFHGSHMEKALKRMLRMRESEITLHAITKKSNIAAYCCADCDIVFLFSDMLQDSWTVFQNIVKELLPHFDPDDIDYKSLFTFYHLRDAYDEVVQMVEAKKLSAQQEEQGGGKMPGANQDFQSHEWKPKVFVRALKKRHGRNKPLAAIVEDDYTMRQLASGVLRLHYDVVSAGDGYMALELYNSCAPDLVFLDIEIPYIDGLAVLRKIIETDPYASVIMFSSHSRHDMLQQAMDLGAKGFVTKPFTAEKLLQYAKHAAASPH